MKARLGMAVALFVLVGLGASSALAQPKGVGTAGAGTLVVKALARPRHADAGLQQRLGGHARPDHVRRRRHQAVLEAGHAAVTVITGCGTSTNLAVVPCPRRR